MTRIRPAELALLAMLIAGGVAVRLAFEVIPNFAPVAAIALFAGYALRNRLLAVAAPLGVMVVSDALIGGYQLPVMLVVYGSLAAPVLAGIWLRSRGDLPASGKLAAVLGGSLAASLFFFVTTNFACWLFSAGAYQPTLAGLAACYTAALPFFRYTLGGDLLFAAALFGGAAMLQGVVRQAGRLQHDIALRHS